MATCLDDLPQEVIDQIVCVTIDAVEAETHPIERIPVAYQEALVLRLVSKRFNAAFTSVIFTTRTAHIEYVIHFWQAPWGAIYPDARIGNISTATHPLFVQHGKSLHIRLPIANIQKIIRISNKVERLLLPCQSLGNIAITIRWPCWDIVGGRSGASSARSIFEGVFRGSGLVAEREYDVRYIDAGEDVPCSREGVEL